MSGNRLSVLGKDEVLATVGLLRDDEALHWFGGFRADELREFHRTALPNVELPKLRDDIIASLVKEFKALADNQRFEPESSDEGSGAAVTSEEDSGVLDEPHVPQYRYPAGTPQRLMNADEADLLAEISTWEHIKQPSAGDLSTEGLRRFLAELLAAGARGLHPQRWPRWQDFKGV